MDVGLVLFLHLCFHFVTHYTDFIVQKIVELEILIKLNKACLQCLFFFSEGPSSGTDQEKPLSYLPMESISTTETDL